jgi:hypothetical protein
LAASSIPLAFIPAMNAATWLATRRRIVAVLTLSWPIGAFWLFGAGGDGVGDRREIQVDPRQGELVAHAWRPT